MQSEKGRALHQQALDAQEQGDFLVALKLEDEAMVVYQTDNDDAGFAEIQAMRLLTLNMLGDKTGDQRYYVLGMHAANASLDLAERAGVKQQIALAHGAIGRAMERVERFEEAASHFDKAVEILPTTQGKHNRKSVIADFTIHAATNRLLAGKLDQEQVALSALKELEASGDASDYEFKVWKSGGYMGLAAGMHKNGKIEEAKKYLAIAEEIAKSDEALKVRREQIATMRKKFGL
ncbi:MAG: hypothetical protein A3D59_02755 [Candidatus Wildermuthbacteria bacterium RIFCSPHIGHO2_02_FULL_47_17]|uniref:Uncharacterized protein n=1 Tax=Candidatus Wildermuthbacteria bacterium RIFCSPHIGHO2_02_FULL_47_17 TaxID=1802452 RepID=A0A1G2R7C8_9BACT|nr:MAG: hypothetical protein A3D59_02755 [Candidatus Wildermuthbacteria bacterium RIFCSPHIGHO2_02_FULL_47_17]